MNIVDPTEAGDRKIKLKGKYLKPVVDFASALNFDRPFDWFVSLEESPIIEMITKLHSSHLCTSDALSLVATEGIAFMGSHDDESGALTEERNQVHFDEIVEILRTAIESLPMTYIVRVEVPEFPGDWPDTIRISDELTLVVGTAMPSPAPKGPKDGLPKFPSERLTYWEFRVSGYAGGGSQSAGITSCLSTIKLLAFKLVEAGVFFRCRRTMSVRSTITSELTGETEAFPLPHAMRQCLGNIAISHEKVFMFARPSSHEISDESYVADHGEAGGERRQHIVLSESLAPVIRFFGEKGSPDFLNLCAAIEWYEDSLSAENQTFAYLAACIGLEAVLGSDESITGLSNRLADRFSFMLGHGRSERAELAQQYIDVLTVRGKLVHAKAARLSAKELSKLTVAQGMLLRVIRHELRILERPR